MGIVAVLLLLFGIAVLLIRQPKIQSWAVQKATQTLEKTLNTTVSIDAVDIDFFKTAVLEGIYIEDQQQDTLFYVNRLGVDIGVFTLLNKEIYINDLSLNGGVINLNRSSTDSTYNFQFIADAFASEDTVVVQTTEETTAWAFGIGDIYINETNINFDDQFAAILVDAALPQLTISIDNLDLENQSVDLDELSLTDPIIELKIPPSTDTVQAETLAFPYAGWDIICETVDIQKAQIAFQQGTTPVNPNQLNVADLGFKNLNINLSDIQSLKDELNVNVEQIAFEEKSGLKINTFQAGILVQNEQIEIKDLSIKTPTSSIQNTTILSMNSFDDVLDFENNVALDIQVPKSRISTIDLQRLAPVIGDVPNIDFQKLKTITLETSARGTLQNLNIPVFDIKVGQALSAQLNGRLKNATQVDQMFFDIKNFQITTSYNQLTAITKGIDIPVGLKDFGTTTLSGNIKGQLDNLTTEQLELTTDTYTAFDLKGRATGLPNVDQLFLDIDIQNIQTQAEDIAGFVSSPLPDPLYRLEKIQYTGQFEGSTTAFDLNGILTTALGDLESDIKLDFVEDYSNAAYNGTFALQDFDLGTLLDQTDQLGTVSLAFKGEGEGFQLDDLDAEALVNISEIDYNNYTYQNIKIDGLVDQQAFNGQLNVDDPNVQLDFNGKVDLNTETPIYNFEMTLDTLQLQAIQLYEKPLNLSADMSIALSGSDVNTVNGDGSITNIWFSNDSIDYQIDSLLLMADQTNPTDKEIVLSSDIMRASLKGNYDLGQFPALFQAYLNEYFPIDTLITPNKIDVSFDDIENPQRFTAAIKLNAPTPLLNVFDPNIRVLKKADLQFEFDSKARILAINGFVDDFMYQENSFEKIGVSGTGDTKKLDLNITTENTTLAGQTYPSISFDASMLDEKIISSLQIANDSIDNQLLVNTLFTRNNGQYQVQLKTPFDLNGETWQVEPDNKIVWTPLLEINDLILQRNKQQIAIQSLNQDNDVNLKVAFDDFKLEEITNFLQLEGNTVAGRLNGQLTLNDLYEELFYDINLNVPTLVVNEEPVGQLNIQANQKAASKTILVDAELQGEKDRVELTGSYDISSRGLDLTADLQKMEMRLLDPFLAGVIRQSKGMLTGTIDVSGTPETPKIDGFVDFDEVSTIIDFTNTRYQIDQEKLTLSSTSINFDKMTLRDTLGGSALLSGQIKHQNFNNMRFDLNFNTDEFLFLNTTAQDNPLFYGKLNVKANAQITGPVELPKVAVYAKSLDQSVFNLSPFTLEESLEIEEYIIFGNPETYREENEEIATIYEVRNSFPADIQLNLDISETTTFNFIVDPVSGDQLTCKGNANLEIGLDPSGAINMFGNYVIAQGSYGFSYADLVRRNFDIQEGSQVVFNGDPLDARFDVSASYKAYTTVYELISQESTLNENEISSAQERQNVFVILSMKGALSDPELAFDIDIPSASGNSTVNSATARKLANLRNDSNEMNKQVFGLLLLGSFISSQQQSASVSDASQDIVLSSVSKLFTNQLNKFADDLIKGVDITFDVNSYKNQYISDGAGGTVTELGVDVEKQIFNDRFSIRAGGNVDVNTVGAGSSFSTIAGEFQLEYELTESGNYVLQVFRKSDFDVLDQSNAVKNGVGLSYQKEFDRRQKRYNKNTNVEPVDSTTTQTND